MNKNSASKCVRESACNLRTGILVCAKKCLLNLCSWGTGHLLQSGLFPLEPVYSDVQIWQMSSDIVTKSFVIRDSIFFFFFSALFIVKCMLSELDLLYSHLEELC